MSSNLTSLTMTTVNEMSDIARLLKEAHHNFLQEVDVFKHANGFGCGIGEMETPMPALGLVIYFESQEEMDAFPYKLDEYKGYPIYKILCGKIRPL